MSDPTIWNNCKTGAPGSYPGNPPNPNSGKNNLYFQISAGDVVVVENIELSNNVTIVVCGHLIVTQELVIGEDNNTFNNGKLVICPGGKLEMKTFRSKNNTDIVVDGLFVVNRIIGQQQNSGNCIYGTGTIVNHDGGAPTIIGTNPDIQQFSFGTSANNCNSSSPVTGGVILPIELLSLKTKVKPDRISLNWTTGTEINNDYFTIERTRNLYGWEVLGFVEGAGTSSVPKSYTFNDIQPLDGLAYYRLKQTDFDGKFKYYGPIAAHYDLGMEGLEFKVLKQYTNWVIAVPNNGVYQVEVYNLQGHRLISERVENNISIPAPQGAVVIRVTDGFARSASRVVM